MSRADEPGRQSAESVAALFVQGCVAFADNPVGLRSWAASHHLPALQAAGQAAFLKGRPGIAYDATDPGGKLVLISNDDGSCSAIAQRADATALGEAVPRLLQQAGVTAQQSGEHDDTEEKALHWRAYVAAKGVRRWSILAGSASGPEGGAAILSAKGD